MNTQLSQDLETHLLELGAMLEVNFPNPDIAEDPHHHERVFVYAPVHHALSDENGDVLVSIGPARLPGGAALPKRAHDLPAWKGLTAGCTFRVAEAEVRRFLEGGLGAEEMQTDCEGVTLS